MSAGFVVRGRKPIQRFLIDGDRFALNPSVHLNRDRSVFDQSPSNQVWQVIGASLKSLILADSTAEHSINSNRAFHIPRSDHRNSIRFGLR
jgi:hypothetical protein